MHIYQASRPPSAPVFARQGSSLLYSASQNDGGDVYFESRTIIFTFLGGTDAGTGEFTGAGFGGAQENWG